jgi:hypothetical protein
MIRYEVKLEPRFSFPEFVEAFNVGFIRKVGGEWNGNLDAFHDYLSWPDGAEYELDVTGWDGCRPMLSAATAGGQCLLAIFTDIFNSNPHVKLNLL